MQNLCVATPLLSPSLELNSSTFRTRSRQLSSYISLIKRPKPPAEIALDPEIEIVYNDGLTPNDIDNIRDQVEIRQKLANLKKKAKVKRRIVKKIMT